MLYGPWHVDYWGLSSAILRWCRLRASVAGLRSIGADDCGSVLPHLASWSAAELPSRPTCAGIHWTLTSFKEPMADRTVQMEQNVGSIWCARPWDMAWHSDFYHVSVTIMFFYRCYSDQEMFRSKATNANLFVQFKPRCKAFVVDITQPKEPDFSQSNSLHNLQMKK